MSKYANKPAQPPLAGLLKHLALYGEVGIMDAATHLSEEEREVLRNACRARKKKKS